MYDIQRFGGAGGTSIHPATIVLLAAAFLLIFVLPRKYIIVPVLAAALLIPLGQRVVVAGIDMMMFRIAILCAWLRLIGGGLASYRGSRPFRMNTIDKVFVLWILSSVITFTILWGEWGAFINRMGLLYDAFGVYFLVRILCPDTEDIDRAIKVFAVICALVVVSMLSEQITGRNLFSLFGGVPEFTDVRQGRLRAQGPFRHAILAGTFGATLFPLFVGLWWQGSRDRFVALLGMASASIITVASMSSTPVFAYLAGIAALCFWPFRRLTPILRWGIAFCLISLHLVMKAPVWALIARVDVVGGSSGYHRYKLVDECIRRFGEWWLIGTRHTGHWGLGMGDTANAFVDTAVTGGLITLVFFLATLVYCFKRLGATRKRLQGQVAAERRTWALGTALFSHVVAFFGIVYFDQTVVAWYALLAMISTATLIPNTLAAASQEQEAERTVSSTAVSRWCDSSWA